MTTDGGGWTLVLNYLHQGGTNPSLNIRSSDLPLLDSTALGVDESGTQYWGHASNSLMNALSFTNVRFYGKTSNHSRIIHFKTTNANTISYFKTGTGSCTGIGAGFTSLAGHTAFLPASMNAMLTNQGDYAIANHPFHEGCARYWIIGITNCGGAINAVPLRWEVDDLVLNCCSAIPNVNPNTFHQIWVK